MQTFSRLTISTLIALASLVGPSHAQTPRAYIIGGTDTSGPKIEVDDAVSGAFLGSFDYWGAGCGQFFSPGCDIWFEYAAPYSAAITPDNRFLWVPNTNRDDAHLGVFVVDTTTGEDFHVDPLYSVPVFSIAFSPNGKTAYLASIHGLEVMDVATRQIITTIPQSGFPFFVVLSPDGSRVYLSNSSGGIAVFNRATLAQIRYISTAPVPTLGAYFAVTPDGRKLFVSCATEVDVIDTQTLAVIATIPLPDAGPIAITLDGKRVFAAWGDLAIIDAATNSLVREIPVASALNGYHPEGLAITPDGRNAWIISRVSKVQVDTLNYSVQPLPPLCDPAHCSPEHRALVFENKPPAMLNSSFRLTGLSGGFESGGCAPGKNYLVNASWQNVSNTSILDAYPHVATLTGGNVVVDVSVSPAATQPVAPGQSLYATFTIRLASCSAFKFLTDVYGYKAAAP